MHGLIYTKDLITITNPAHGQFVLMFGIILNTFQVEHEDETTETNKKSNKCQNKREAAETGLLML